MIDEETKPDEDEPETDPWWETGIHNKEIDEMVIADLEGTLTVGKGSTDILF